MNKNQSPKKQIRHWLTFFYFPVLLIYLECIFRIFIIKTPPTGTFFLELLFCIVPGAIISLLCSIFPPRANKILSVIFSGIFVLWFLIQTVYVNVFQTPLVISSIGGAGQVLQFMDIILSTIAGHILPIILMIAFPVIIHIIFSCTHTYFGRISCRHLPWFILPVILPLIFIYIFLAAGGKSAGSAYSIYYHERPGTLILNRFGLLACTKNDIKTLLFPNSASIESLELPNLSETLNERETTIPDTEITEETAQTEEPVVIEPNVMDIDFAALNETETNEVYRAMNDYFASVNPTYTNEYTGIFEGYNLIFLTAESFSPYVIDKELTPTLYKLANEGFVFNNFYNPVWGVSTSDGEYVNVQGLIPKSGVWSMSKSSDNWLPFTMGNQFLQKGYTTLAYHNHSYDYYDRDSSHPNLGYTYQGYGNGLDVTYVWPESDLEMMELTIPEYINKDQFSIYYMTVSGHMPYSWGGNAMSNKHKDKVADLPYSDTIKGYLACHIELDLALEYLLEQLEAAGKLDNTVIVMAADHYPYGLEKDQMTELVGHEVEQNFELYKSTLVLWNAGMAEQPVQVDKYCSSLDIIPTLSNLFGLEYDSRLLMGRDILSDSTPLVIFSNKSWITNRAMYNSQTGTVIPFDENDTISSEYIQAINQQVANKFTFSTYILDYNYYEYLFERPQLTPSVPDQPQTEESEISS